MKKTVLLIVFGVALCQAQAPGVDWMQRYGGNAANFFRSVIATQDGGFLLGGWSNSGASGIKTEPMIGFSYDYWIVKTDGAGTVQWDETIGGGGSFFDELRGEILNVVREAAGGGYFLGGHSDSGVFGDKTEPTFGGYDFWIVRTDASGNIQWQKDIGGSEDDELYTLEPTPDGGCMAGGPSHSGLSGNKTEASRGMRDYWVVKLSADGQIEWQKTIGGSSTDVLSSVLVLEDGYLLAGYSASGVSGDKTEASKGGGDFWIVRLDTAGGILWQKTIGGNSGDLLYRAVKTDSGFVLAGESYSGVSGDKTQPSRGSSDFWLVKTDLSGNVVFDSAFGGSAQDLAYDVKVVGDSGFILIGTTLSPASGDKQEPGYGEEDGWVVRADTNGGLLWEKTYGGTNTDGFNQVIPLADGGFAYGGSTLSLVSGNITVPGFSYDYWLVKTQPENLAAPEIQPKAFMVYPNPATESVSIRFAESVNTAEIKIFNALSQQLSVQVIENVSDVVVALPEPKGVYFFRIDVDDKINTVKIIKR